MSTADHIGGINRKYAMSGVGKLSPDRNMGSDNLQRIEPLRESPFVGNLVGTSDMKFETRQEVEPTNNKSSWKPVPSIFTGEAEQQPNTFYRQEHKEVAVDGSKGKISMSRREVRPKEYW